MGSGGDGNSFFISSFPPISLPGIVLCGCIFGGFALTFFTDLLDGPETFFPPLVTWPPCAFALRVSLPTKESYNAPPTRSPTIPPNIVPAKGTGIKVPRADPIVAPIAFAAALPGFSLKITVLIIKSTSPPMIGILPSALPASLPALFPARLFKLC